MLKSLNLRNVGPSPELSVGFSKRMNLFTGDNGLGKSFLLDIAWWALTRTWAGNPAWPRHDSRSKAEIRFEAQGRARSYARTSAFRPVGEVWPVARGAPANHGLVIYARSDGGFSVWDPARNYGRRRRPDIFGPDNPPAYHFTTEKLWDGVIDESWAGSPMRVLSNGLIRDWTTWYYKRHDEKQGPYSVFVEVLEALSPDPNEVIEPGEPTKVSVEDSREIPTLRMPYDIVPVIFASAGMKRILGLAYLLVWTWFEHVAAVKLTRQKPADRVVLLIDEVEAHLHPQWQRTILPAIVKVVRRLNVHAKIQLIAATHAPLVLASVEPFFEPKEDSVSLFELRQGQVELTRLDWRPRGDASAWLTSEAFGLKQARSKEAEAAIETAKVAMLKPGLSPTDVSSIQGRLAAVLKETDPFWVRWMYHVQKSGAGA